MSPELIVSVVVLIVAVSGVYLTWDAARMKIVPQVDVESRPGTVYLALENRGLHTVNPHSYEWLLNGNTIPSPRVNARILPLEPKSRRNVGSIHRLQFVEHLRSNGAHIGVNETSVVAIDQLGTRFKGPVLRFEVDRGPDA